MNNLVIIYHKKVILHSYYKNLLKSLSEKGVKVYFFMKGYEKNDALGKNIFIKTFKDKEDLIKKIKENNLQNSRFITFYEKSLSLTNEILKIFNHNFTENYKAFTDKSLQRELLLKYDKNITINFKKLELEELQNANKYLNYPFIIKPITSAQSRGVSIINNNHDLEEYIKNYKNILLKLEIAGYKNSSFLVEEYIDGKAFSCDYFVDENGNYTIVKPVYLEFFKDWGIDDFGNVTRIISKDVENMLDLEKLKIFIEKNIKALNIKNTFVHHEFKYTTKGIFKTIELNGRIGGFRADMYNTSYNINLFNYLFQKQLNNFDDKKLVNNYIIIAIYSQKEGILTGYNDDYIEKIKKLKSISNIRFLENKIGQKVGPSKLGYTRLGFIRLKNKDLEQLKKDYNYIKDNYFNLLKIKH